MAIRVPPPPGPSDRSANLRAIRRRDTGPELRIRRALHRLGFRYRVDFPVDDGQPRPVRPDIAFPSKRLAVFIDGCFWHGCPEHGRPVTKRNQHYWGPKLARNKERDATQSARLEAAGWQVLRFWEHEPVDSVVRQIVRAIGRS